jgi:hypothetical protein
VVLGWYWNGHGKKDTPEKILQKKSLKKCFNTGILQRKDTPKILNKYAIKRYSENAFKKYTSKKI